MPSVDVERMRFEFPDDWLASKYDSWRFYGKRFNSKQGWIAKAVDIVAITPAGTCWLIEVKDYSHPAAVRDRIPELPSIAAAKARDTLAGLVIASTVAEDEHERDHARAAVRCDEFRLALHFEQPTDPLSAEIAANLQPLLERSGRPIDAHPVVTTNSTATLWRASRV